MRSKTLNGIFSVAFTAIFLLTGCVGTQKSHLELSGLNEKSYLEPNDIDIFIKNFDNIQEILEENWHYDIKNGKEWNEYSKIFEKLFNFILDADEYFDDTLNFENRIKEFQEDFNKLINYTPPKELNDAFEMIGWKNVGNKKFWTILFGYEFLFQKKIFNAFFEEIEANIEEEYKETNEYIKLIMVKKNMVNVFFKIISEKDLQLIEKRIDDLIDLDI